MALLTHFRAQQTCLHCKQTGTAWIWSKLGDRGATYEIGDRIAEDIPQEDIDDVCLKVQPVKAGELTHILLSWDCQHCKRTNFAQIVVDVYVRSIETIELNPATLSTLHYIAESIADMLETIVGEPLYNMDGPEIRPDWLDSLRRALASGRRW